MLQAQSGDRSLLAAVVVIVIIHSFSSPAPPLSSGPATGRTAQSDWGRPLASVANWGAAPHWRWERELSDTCADGERPVSHGCCGTVRQGPSYLLTVIGGCRGSRFVSRLLELVRSPFRFGPRSYHYCAGHLRCRLHLTTRASTFSLSLSPVHFEAQNDSTDYHACLSPFGSLLLAPSNLLFSPRLHLSDPPPSQSCQHVHPSHPVTHPPPSRPVAPAPQNPRMQPTFNPSPASHHRQSAASARLFHLTFSALHRKLYP